MRYAKMKKWAIVNAPLSPYQAPELQTKRLQGDVFEHERFTDGESVTTSTILSILHEVETWGRGAGTLVVTENTTYWLDAGDMCSGYQAWCDENGLLPSPKPEKRLY